MDQLQFIYREDVPHLPPLVIQKAKEGIVEAQYLCWELYFWYLANTDFSCDPDLRKYVAPIVLKVLTENVKIESLLPFYKQRAKLKNELDRLKFGALFLSILEEIKRNGDLTTEEAEIALVNFAITNCSSTNPEHRYAREFLRITTRDKLKHEICYYREHYPKWAFYLDHLASMGLSFERLSKHKRPTKETN